MSLELGTSSGGGSLGTKLDEGVFGKTGIIQSAVQHFDKQLGDYEPDLFLEITIDSGSQYEDVIDIFGSFGRDERTNEVTGWGSAFKVDQVLQDLGAYNSLTEEQRQLNGNRLPDGALQALQGMKVHYVVFCTGKHPNKDKPIYNNFWKIMPASDSVDPDVAFAKIQETLMNDDYARERLTKGRDYMETYKANNSGGRLPSGTGNSGGAPANSPGGIDENLPI